MSYKVHIDAFEGPFDLLLYLVSRQKVDIGAISITDIVDQYMQEMSQLGEVDLDVASDFLLVAATLLKIKAESLLPKQQTEDVDEELAELSPSAARDILIARLLEYKQYKNAAASLDNRFEAEKRMHARTFGPDEEFLGLMPDFLRGVEVEKLRELAAASLARREIFLLESEHIAAKPIPVERFVRSIHETIKEKKKLRFSELAPKGSTPELVVVNFLAILELYKRAMVLVYQKTPFGDIEISYIEGSGELLLDDGDDMPEQE